METDKELTAKQKLFVENYVSNGYKLQKAYMSAYPNAKPNTANSKSYELMKKEGVRRYMRELQHDRFEAMGVSADKIAQRLSEIAFDEDPENKSYALQAMKLLQIQMGLDKKIVEAKVETTNIKIDIEDDNE